MADKKVVDREAFEDVAKRLEAGEALTFEMIGEVFLQEFWCALVMSLMDAGDASRAISGAISRLRSDATPVKRAYKKRMKVEETIQ